MRGRTVGLLLLIWVVQGCGPDKATEARLEAERQARASAAAREMLAADSAKIRDGAALKAKEAVERRADPSSGIGTNASDASKFSRVVPPPSVGLATPPTLAQSFGFDDSPDGVEATRLLAVYIDHLKEPETAKFRSVQSGRFTLTNGANTLGVCGEVNAKNGYGGYTGFKGFVVWRSSEGDKIGSQSTEYLENAIWELAAKSVGCATDTRTN